MFEREGKTGTRRQYGNLGLNGKIKLVRIVGMAVKIIDKNEDS